LFPNGIVHKLHALAFSGNDGILQLLGRTYTDDRGDGAIDHEDLIHSNASAAVLSLHQILGDHAPK
jgi:hypothetical protein